MPMTDQSNRKFSLSTRVAQALHFVEEDTGAVIPAIQPSATYARDENYEIRKPYWYRRDGSQTTSHAEAVIADIIRSNAQVIIAGVIAINELKITSTEPVFIIWTK